MGYVENIFPKGISSKYKGFFDDAADYWNKIIVSGKGGITFSSSLDVSRGCGVDYTYPAGYVIEGLSVLSVVEPIDGAGSILGSAGVCYNNGAGYPLIGRMRFDSADVDNLIRRDDFLEVVIHEIAHTIGLGVRWNQYGLIRDPCPPNTCGNNDPFYGGVYANAAYQRLGGRGSIPLADTGGGGTRNVHWRESVFGRELMTGYINSGVTNPLSVISIEAFRDIEYEVDSSFAQPYSIPNELERPVAAELLEIGGIDYFEVLNAEEELERIKIELEIEIERNSGSDLTGVIAFVMIGFIMMMASMFYLARVQRQQINQLMLQKEDSKGTRNPMISP